MVQVLPGIPGFGTQLAQMIGQAGTQLGAGYLQGQQSGREAKQAEGAFSVLNNPNSTPLQQIHAFTSLPEQYKKHAEPLWRAMIEPKIKADETIRKLQTLGVAPNTIGTQAMGSQPQTQVKQQGIAQLPQIQQGNQQAIQQLLQGQETVAQKPVSKYADKIQAIDQDIENLTQLAGLKGWNAEPEIAAKGAAADIQIQNKMKQRQYYQKLEEADVKEARNRQAEERQEERLKEKESREILNNKSNKFFDRIEQDRIKLPEERYTQDIMRDAVKSGKLDPFSLNHFAEIAKNLFGFSEESIGYLLDPTAKQHKTTLKKYVLENVGEFRGSTTKGEIELIENSVSQIGVTQEANMASLEVLKASTDIREKRLELTDKAIEDGIPPYKIPAVVSKQLSKYENERKDQLIKDLHELRERKVTENTASIGQAFEQLPPAKEYYGVVMEGDDGTVYESDGIRWYKVK